jgi:hypothetical protein
MYYGFIPSALSPAATAKAAEAAVAAETAEYAELANGQGHIVQPVAKEAKQAAESIKQAKCCSGLGREPTAALASLPRGYKGLMKPTGFIA